MKLYDCTPAPSPKRARVFIAEKGLDIPRVEVDLAQGEHLSAEFKALNPACTVPVLELDDGRVITENVGIARYLEEIHPEPPLLGRAPYEKADIASWNARIESEGLAAVAEAFRNRASGFRGRALTGPESYEQIPSLVERGRRRAAAFFGRLDRHLAERDFICGEAYSMADITALVTVEFAGWIKLQIGADQRNLQRWHQRVSARPSAAA